MVLSRKSASKTGKSVPQDWCEGLAVLLNDSYKTECKSQKRYFDVYGQIFPEELLVTVSYLSEANEADTPITLFLSSEGNQIDSAAKVKETQLAFTDLSGLFFDEVLSSEEWSNFEANWQEVKHKNQTYFYKLTRENVNLTLEANKLLGDEFIEAEEEYEVDLTEEDDKTFH